MRGADVVSHLADPSSAATHDEHKINSSDALRDPLLVFLPILRQLPGWPKDNVDASQIQITRISGTMTNLVFRADNVPLSCPGSTVILRIFSPGDMLFSRPHEKSIFLTASKVGIGPRCLLEFSNGRVEQFIPGDIATAHSMRKASAAVAAALTDFHVRLLPGALPLVPRQMKTSLSEIEEEGRDVLGASKRYYECGDKNAIWDRLRCWLETALTVAPEESAALGVSGLRSDIDSMERVARREFGPPWLAFCHNDLQSGNIILQPSVHHDDGGDGTGATSKNGQSTILARFIDYEYATLGDVAFDVANHWCEYAADYESKVPEALLDWRKLPTVDEMEAFCEAYISSLLTEHAESALAGIVRAAASAATYRGEDGIEHGQLYGASKALLKRASAYMPLSDIQWGLWGLIQAKTSCISFDYMTYASLRLQHYEAQKSVLLNFRTH